MSNDTDPSIRDLIAEAHAAREAGDRQQMDAALAELARVSEAANAPDLAAAGGDTFGGRLAGGIAGAAEGLVDVGKGTLQTAKRLGAAIGNPNLLPVLGTEMAQGAIRSVTNVRDVTQRFREGEASPEELARAWTVGAATLLGPVAGGARIGGAEALDVSPRGSLTAPFRAGGRAVVHGLLKTEDVLSPRSALYRLRLKQARAAEAAPTADRASVPEAMPEPPPSNPDVQRAIADFEAGKISGEDLRTAIDMAGGRTGADLQEAQAGIAARATPTEAPGSPVGEAGEAARPISPGPPGTGPSKAPADARIPANSYQELQRLLRSGVPKEQIQVNYWTRGGAAEQSVPPIPVAARQPVRPAPSSTGSEMIQGTRVHPDMAIRMGDPDILRQFPTDLLRDRLAKNLSTLRPEQIQTVEEYLAQQP